MCKKAFPGSPYSCQRRSNCNIHRACKRLLEWTQVKSLVTLSENSLSSGNRVFPESVLNFTINQFSETFDVSIRSLYHLFNGRLAEKDCFR